MFLVSGDTGAGGGAGSPCSGKADPAGVGVRPGCSLGVGGGAVHTAASLFQQPVTWAVRTEGQATGQSVAGGRAGGGFDGRCLSFREHRFPVEALGSGLQPGGAAQLAGETRVGSGWDVPGQREH